MLESVESVVIVGLAVPAPDIVRVAAREGWRVVMSPQPLPARFAWLLRALPQALNSEPTAAFAPIPEPPQEGRAAQG